MSPNQVEAPGPTLAARVRSLERMLFRKKTEMIDAADALPGRDTPMPVVDEQVSRSRSTMTSRPSGSSVRRASFLA